MDCATRELTFDPEFCDVTGYRPQTGDWVMVGVRRVIVGEGEEGREEESDDEEGEEVEEVRPLRERETEGQVTSLGQGHGLIDDDIIFTPDVCGRHQQVRVGEMVRVRCVECRHHGASWRAVSMRLLSSHPHTVTPSPESPSLPLRILHAPSQNITQSPNK